MPAGTNLRQQQFSEGLHWPPERRSTADRLSCDVLMYAAEGCDCRCGHRSSTARPYLGAIRIAPSKRMTSPLSIGFCTTCTASAPYSDGFPNRLGCGT